MVDYKINSEDMPNIEDRADILMAAMVTDKEGDCVKIDNIVCGAGAVEDMAEAMGKLVGNIADQTGKGSCFILAVMFSAAKHLASIYGECED